MSYSVFGWGANSHGQLGLGYASEMVTRPVPIVLPFDEPIELISGGGGHVLIYTASNHIFSCGWNNKGQLGLGDRVDRSAYEEVQLELRPDQRVSSIACGWDTSAVLTTDFRLFLFGGNSFRQLGFHDSADVLIPREIQLLGQKPIQVELSMRQMVIRTESSSICLSGKSQAIEEIRAKNPQIISTKNYALMMFCPEAKETQYVSAGQHHIIYSTGGEQIIGMGQNKFNQSGITELPECNVLKLRSGWTHNACLLASGAAYLWGRNNYGQLGIGWTSESERKPVKLNVPERIEEIHLGSEHGLVVDIKGDVYTWGWNEHGNCGNGSEENVLTPERVNLRQRAIRSCCGAGFCMVVTARDDVVE